MIHGDNILILYSSKNVKGKKDATGAFIPEAKNFGRTYNVPEKNIIGIECPGVSKPKRREAVYDAILEAAGDKLFHAIAFFCHGWPSGIQFGFTKKYIPELVEVINDHADTDVKITLYACLAAENDVRDKEFSMIGPATDGGFADMLRDEMVRGGLDRGWVDAHKTAGHTAWNPYVIRFYCSDVEDENFGAEGGAWLIQPRSELWKKWVTALKDTKHGLRYRFPFMTETQIRDELLGYQ